MVVHVMATTEIMVLKQPTLLLSNKSRNVSAAQFSLHFPYERETAAYSFVTTSFSVVVQNKCKHFAYFQKSIITNISHSSIFILLGSRLEDKLFLNFPFGVLPKCLEFCHIYETFIGYRFVAFFCILRT
jgi:hypothetical protein